MRQNERDARFRQIAGDVIYDDPYLERPPQIPLTPTVAHALARPD